MTEFAYLARCIKGLNFDKLLETAKYVSKKTGKGRALVLIDIIYCGLRYKAGYNDYKEFELYLVKGKNRGNYLTRGLNNNIIRDYNDKSFFHIFDDKTEFNKDYAEFIGREWLDLRNADYSAFKKFLCKNPKFVAKPVDGQCGKGVEVVELKDGDNCRKVYDRLLKNEQFLVEEYVIQHGDISALCPTSVNTMRVFTIVADGRAHMLQTALKLGNTGAVDNFYSGGMYCFADENGVIYTPAIDREDNVYAVHPATGKNIVGFKVPMFDKVKETVEAAALVHPEVAYVGWDVALTPNGPVLIEGNAYPGIFQPRASFCENGGVLPLYRKYISI